ncbi:ROK family protein [Hypericibacter sp.]|uniref:ROK family protein n=1 Tax=Hypericibacter sp. TaxID=2705401 RepID=UPI003D6D58EF
MTEPATVIGVDIGGTKTAIGAVRLPDGEVLEKILLPTPTGAASGDEFLTDLVRRIGTFVDHRSDHPSAVGISVCELVDLEGQIRSGHRVRWEGLDPLARFAEIMPAALESDVRAAALAEARLGAGRRHRQFFYLNLGTGISSCLVLDGKPHAGHRGHALAIASSPISVRAPDSGKLVTQTLEDVAGGEGLAKLAMSAGLPGRSAKELIELADKGDGPAQGLILDAARAIGVSLGLAINILDPEAVIIGGGLVRSEGLFWNAILRETRAHIWSHETRTLSILKGSLAGDAALIGAALRAYAISSPKLR